MEIGDKGREKWTHVMKIMQMSLKNGVQWGLWVIWGQSSRSGRMQMQQLPLQSRSELYGTSALASVLWT